MIRTRTENLNGVIYCAYCGKELKNNNSAISCWPEQPLICNCEKAKQELKLYDDLKALYQSPIADNLIDRKVEIYKNSLLGKSDSLSTTITSYSGLVKNLMAKDEYSNTVRNTLPDITGVIDF